MYISKFLFLYILIVSLTSNKLAYFKTSVKNNMEKIKNMGVPKWFNEVIEKEEVSKEEELELENLFKEFKEARI